MSVLGSRYMSPCRLPCSTPIVDHLASEKGSRGITIIQAYQEVKSFNSIDSINGISGINNINVVETHKVISINSLVTSNSNS